MGNGLHNRELITWQLSASKDIRQRVREIGSPFQVQVLKESAGDPETHLTDQLALADHLVDLDRTTTIAACCSATRLRIRDMAVFGYAFGEGDD